MNIQTTDPPKSASRLRQQLDLARAYLTRIKTERQYLGVPILKAHLHRREDLALEVATVEAEIDALGDAIPLVQAEEQRARQEADRREREQLVGELRTMFDGRARECDDNVTALAAKPIPTVEELRALRERGRQCEDLRVVLLTATRDGRFSKTIDPVGRLERLYEDQQNQRRRSFSLLRSPGTPRPALPRNDRLVQLRELLSREKGVGQ